MAETTEFSHRYGGRYLKKRSDGTVGPCLKTQLGHPTGPPKQVPLVHEKFPKGVPRQTPKKRSVKQTEQLLSEAGQPFAGPSEYDFLRNRLTPRESEQSVNQSNKKKDQGASSVKQKQDNDDCGGTKRSDSDNVIDLTKA